MAVTVTDNRTVLYQDGLTNVTGASTTETTFYAEAASCAAEAYNIATGQIYWSGTTPNFETAGNELIYVWSAVVATQNGYKEATAADSSHAFYLSDGTNDLIIYMAGNDRDVFKHADGQVSFQCFLIDIDYLDTLNTDGDLAAIGGSYASFDPTSTSMDVGAHYTTLSKALGGGTNCYMDIIRYGGADDGISITGGTTGARGTFAEIAVEDRDSADGKAHGILREYTGGAYGVQGTLKFGTTATGDSWFEDSGASVTFEDRPVADDKFKLIILGNTTGGEETHFILSDSTIQSARPGVECDFSSTGINTLTLTAVNFLNLLNAITFPGDGATYAHNVNDCSFNNCGQVDIGVLDAFSGCTISNTNCAASTEGSIYIDNATVDDNAIDLTFDEYTGKYAVWISAAVTAGTTLIFDNWQFDGSGTDVYWAGTTGTLTISKTNGSNPTTSATAGGTVSFVGPSVTVAVHAATVDNTDVADVRVMLEAADGTGPFPYNETVTIVNSGTTATVTHTAHGMATGDKIAIRAASLNANNGVFTITVTGVNAYTYTMGSTPGSSPTGTIKANFVAVKGLTDVNGDISVSRVYPSAQPVTGRARKSTTAPFYKTAPLAGTISSTLGLSTIAVMILDQ